MVKASDQGTPERTATVKVSVFVRRDKFAPEFTQKPYKVKLEETKRVGDTFTRVQANDKDRRVG